jgi:perosamine synthetase
MSSTPSKIEMSIPFFRATIGQEEMDGVMETLASGWLTSGPKVKAFEKEFAEAVGAKHAIAVNSATAALHLALESLNIGPGDEVLVPTMTFAATAEVVIHLGATPVLVDCDPGTLNVSLSDLAAKRTAKTKVVMPVHYAGQPCQMQEIADFADQHGLHVVEDAAHAFPAAYRGQAIGSLSLATCFSFYANKTMTTGEGGMLTTNDDATADRARKMSLHGLSRGAWNRFTAKGSWYYEIEAPGYKYNLPDVAAAIGLGQLHQAENFLQERRRCAARYISAFADSKLIDTLEQSPDVDSAWHLLVIKLNLPALSIDRSEFIVKLNEAGIGTSVHYTPLHLHPLYRERFGYKPEDMPIASGVFEQIVSLPIFPSMTDEQLEYVIDNVLAIAAEHQR